MMRSSHSPARSIGALGLVVPPEEQAYKEGENYIGSDTVRKYDPKTGKEVMAIMRAEPQPGAAPRDAAPPARQPGRGSNGPVGTFPQQPGGRGRVNADPRSPAEHGRS